MEVDVTHQVVGYLRTLRTGEVLDAVELDMPEQTLHTRAVMYTLTPEVLAEAGHKVVSVVADDADETHGVNDRIQLAAAEGVLRSRTNRRWQTQGVTMVDPSTTYVDVTVQLAPDVTIFPGAILGGRTTVGRGTEIGPGCRLEDSTVGEGCHLEHTVARLSEIGDECVVGPYAVLEPGTVLEAGTRTGPFYTGGTGAGLEA